MPQEPKKITLDVEHTESVKAAISVAKAQAGVELTKILAGAISSLLFAPSTDRDRGYLTRTPIDAIVAERNYQRERYPDSEHQHSYAEMAMILSTEVGEALSRMKEIEWPDDEPVDEEVFGELRSELAQVGATAHWIMDVIDYTMGWPLSVEDLPSEPVERYRLEDRHASMDSFTIIESSEDLFTIIASRDGLSVRASVPKHAIDVYNVKAAWDLSLPWVESDPHFSLGLLVSRHELAKGYSIINTNYEPEFGFLRRNSKRGHVCIAMSNSDLKLYRKIDEDYHLDTALFNRPRPGEMSPKSILAWSHITQEAIDEI